MHECVICNFNVVNSRILNILFAISLFIVSSPCSKDQCKTKTAYMKPVLCDYCNTPGQCLVRITGGGSPPNMAGVSSLDSQA